jgi:hypothetical protein
MMMPSMLYEAMGEPRARETFRPRPDQKAGGTWGNWLTGSANGRQRTEAPHLASADAGRLRGGLERDFQSPAPRTGVVRHGWFKSPARNTEPNTVPATQVG